MIGGKVALEVTHLSCLKASGTIELLYPLCSLLMLQTFFLLHANTICQDLKSHAFIYVALCLCFLFPSPIACRAVMTSTCRSSCPEWRPTHQQTPRFQSSTRAIKSCLLTERMFQAYHTTKWCRLSAQPRTTNQSLFYLYFPTVSRKHCHHAFFFTFLATPRTTSSRSKHAFPKIARDDIKRRMLHIAHRDTERRDAPNQALFYSCAAYFNCYRLVNVFEHVKRRFSSMPFFFILVSSRCFQSRC